MTYDHGALDAALAQAAGNDETLLRELRGAFEDSARRQIDLLGRSRCDANWLYAALRLKGIAASFGAAEVLSLAEAAAEGAPGDPAILRDLRAALDRAAPAG